MPTTPIVPVDQPFVRARFTPDTHTLGAMIQQAGQLQGQQALSRGQGTAATWAGLAQAFTQYQQMAQQRQMQQAALALKERDRQDDLAIKRAEMAEKKAERDDARKRQDQTDQRLARTEARDIAQDFGRMQAPGAITQEQMDLTRGDPSTFARTRYSFGPGTAEGPELMATPEQLRQASIDKATADERAAQAAGRLRDDVRADKTLDATLANQRVMQGIAQQNATTSAANSQARIGGGTASLPPSYRNALERVLMSVPQNRRGARVTQANRLFEEQNEPELKDFIRQSAIEGENVDTKNQVLGRMATISSLRDTQAILKEMKAKGVPTNILAGTAEDVARKLGTSTNPEYVSLGNRLAGTLINYRRAATGVAFGEKEGAQYARMFPNYKNTMPVNLALIDGLMREMTTYDKTYWEHKLGKDGAALVMGADASGPAGSGSGKVNPNR